MKSRYSLPVMIAIAALMLVAGLFVHVPTALGQGIDEHIVTGWQGVYEVDTHQYFLQVSYQGEAPVPFPTVAWPSSHFVSREGKEWTTAMDDLTVVQMAAKNNPGKIESIFGTQGNVASIQVIFPVGPVAYATSFLQSLSRLQINPDSFGGPNIPPGIVPYKLLSGDELHIDTLTNNNTLYQCQPGQTPPELTHLLQ